MAFGYDNRGDDIVLKPDSALAFRMGGAITEAVTELAEKNVAETGRACDVYADDGATVLLERRPAKKATPAPTGAVAWLERNVQDPGPDDEFDKS